MHRLHIEEVDRQGKITTWILKRYVRHQNGRSYGSSQIPQAHEEEGEAMSESACHPRDEASVHYAKCVHSLSIIRCRIYTGANTTRPPSVATLIVQ